MATGTNYITKQKLLDAIQTSVFGNDDNLTESENIQKAIKDVVESFTEIVITDTPEYTLYRRIVDNDFSIRLVVKSTVTLTDLELLPPGLAILATFDDVRYISYNPSNDTDKIKYTLSLTFNKLVSDNPFIAAGDAYFKQLHLMDNVGDSSGSFSYSTAGGTGNYDSPIIRTTGFKVSGTITEDTGLGFVTGGILEFTFKGSLIGRL